MSPKWDHQLGLLGFGHDGRPWGKCTVEIWTHKIRGLTESDFYLSAKADRAFEAAGKS